MAHCFSWMLFTACTEQCCQMVAHFHTKIPNFCIFWEALECKIMVYFTAFLVLFTAIWYTCVNLVYLFTFWYIAPRKIWQPWHRMRFCRFKKIEIANFLLGASLSSFQTWQFPSVSVRFGPKLGSN
jgi:hypothetical protein